MGHRKGIKIEAYLPISKASVLEVGSQPDQGGGLFHALRKKSFIFTQGYYDDQKEPFNVDFNVNGMNFKYKSLLPGTPQVPIAGKITEVSVSVAGQLGVEISKLHLDVEDAAKLWKKDDPLAAFAKLLVGDDTIIGADDPNQGDRNLWGGKGNDLLWGRRGDDFLDGFKGNDINDGGPGNDYLKDTRGDDWFQFSTGLQISASANLDYNFDTIKKFGKGDSIYLATNIFQGIGNKLSKKEFSFGDEATSANHRILYDRTTGTGYWDRDGSGSMYEAIPFFQLENGGGNINHKVFVMGVMYGDGY